MIQDNFPKHLIIHHSWSEDHKQTCDWAGIRTYHMSYRYNGDIITRAQWQKYASQGIKVGLETPWIDIGYHAGAEYVKGFPTLQLGRPDIQHGAHCDEQKMNTQSLGFCFVGNFDLAAPPTDLFMVGVNWAVTKCHQFEIPVENIHPHNLYATYKTCPGKKFPIFDFMAKVKALL
jgi:N-acetylmuramoyl-L-alanine amidase